MLQEHARRRRNTGILELVKNENNKKGKETNNMGLKTNSNNKYIIEDFHVI